MGWICNLLHRLQFSLVIRCGQFSKAFFSQYFLPRENTTLHLQPTFLYCRSITVVPIFPLLLSSDLPTSTSHIQSSSYPIVFVHGPFIHVPWQPILLLSPVTPFPLPSGHCQFVLYFHVSGSNLLAYLFCWLGSTYRWDHMVFVPYHLAYFT